MQPSGDYFAIRYLCNVCETDGVIREVLINPDRFGVVGYCIRCDRTDTVWYALRIDPSSQRDGELLRTKVSYRPVPDSD
jgi:hypothetical protein